MSLVCPVCQTSYAIGFEGRADGAVCGDYSHDQVEPCVGRLMPWEAFKAAEWRDEVELRGELGAMFRQMFATLKTVAPSPDVAMFAAGSFFCDVCEENGQDPGMMLMEICLARDKSRQGDKS